MPREEEPRTQQTQDLTEAGAVLTSPDRERTVVAEAVTSQDARVIEGNAANAKSTKADVAPALNKWETFWRGVLHVDAAKMEPWIALRNALGVAIPLGVGIAIGMPLGGLAVASGALNVSYSDGHDPYRERGRRMLAASVLCAVAVMAGGLVGHHNIAAVAL